MSPMLETRRTRQASGETFRERNHARATKNGNFVYHLSLREISLQEAEYARQTMLAVESLDELSIEDSLALAWEAIDALEDL